MSQPGGENPEPLTLRGAHTGHLVLGVGDSELLQLLWGEGILQVPVTPLLPSLAVNPMVPARLSDGLAVWTQRGRECRAGGGEPGRCPRISGRLDVGQEKRVWIAGSCLA